MTTVRDILQDALIELTVLDPNMPISADDAARCLRTLNRMLDAWQTEELMIYSTDRASFSFVAGQQSYTIGVGGNFNTTYAVRPGQIDMASVIMNGVELPIEIMNDEQWRDVTLKSVSSTFPLQMWSNGNYPLNVLYFWPIPTMVNTLILYLWNQVTAFPSVNSTVTFPQGYEDALVLNLAVRLAPGYGTQASPTTIDLARQAKARIKKLNWEPTYRSVDSALAGTHQSVGQRSRGYVVD